MSDYKCYKGRIKLIERLENESDKDYCERVTGFDYADDMRETIYEASLEDQYIVLNNNIYEIIEKKEFPDGDFETRGILPDGSILFIARFYNGGTCLSEVLEDIDCI